jgi:hypothetical protein
MRPSPFGVDRWLVAANRERSNNKAPLRVSFPLIDTDLNPHQHCDPKLFVRDRAPDEFGDCNVETINLAVDMSLSDEFKLVRADSLVQ